MRSGKPRAAHFLFASLLALFVPGGGPALAQSFRFSTENDLLSGSDSPDDLYTFAVALEVERPGYVASLRENAFTDRAAGIRFDETYLSLGLELGALGPWSLSGEAGLVRTGRGLFGERLQNAVHRAVGSDRVALDYLPSELHPRLAAVAERRFAAGDRADWGPRAEVDLAPGLRSWLLLGATAAWRPSPRLAVAAKAGVRFTRADYDPLEPHLEEITPAAEIGVLVGERFFVSWSYGDYGERREHLSAGYRFALGGAEGGAGARR